MSGRAFERGVIDPDVLLHAATSVIHPAGAIGTIDGESDAYMSGRGCLMHSKWRDVCLIAQMWSDQGTSIEPKKAELGIEEYEKGYDRPYCEGFG